MENMQVNTPERVLVLLTVLDRGGAETMAMNYLRHFDRSRVVYDFLVNRKYRGDYEDEIEALGGRIYRMCPMYPQYFARYKREFQAFLHEHPEYRIIHSNLEDRSYFPLRIAKEEGVPVRIAHAHNAMRGFNAKTLFRDYFRLRLPGNPTHMFACSQEAGDWLFGKKRRDHVIQIPNAIDVEQYRYNPETGQQVRAEFGVADPNTLVVGHVGRFAPQKNHKQLIEIFAEVHKRQSNSVLWLVGGGHGTESLQGEVRARIRELGLQGAVKFLGVRSDVPRILQGMDVFVMPSLHEGLAIALLEAQAVGLPCVMSDVITQQVNVSGSIRTCALQDDPDIWAETILECASTRHDDLDRTQQADVVRAAGFDISENAKQLEQWYLDTLTRCLHE